MIKKGNQVEVLTGKDKGKKGEVIEIYRVKKCEGIPNSNVMYFCLSSDIQIGDVIEFTDDTIEERQMLLAKEKGYEIVDHSMVLYVKHLKK